LKNWRNFRSVDVEMGNRVFLIGPTASGKSNFLDVFRFLHDIVKPGGGLQIHDRPDDDDDRDKLLLTQTHLEQSKLNHSFRDIFDFFKSVRYLHLIPQLIRYPAAFSGPGIPGDPYGQKFLEHVAETSEKTRKSRLKKIEAALRITVPQLKHIVETRDQSGIPHLEVVYEHWIPEGARQREEQFSDGTLRLIGLLWALLDEDSLLLLEEPELSLNIGIISKLPALIYRLHWQKGQVILSTHSADLLSDKGIGGEEVLLLVPGPEGTKVKVASSIQEIRALLEGGLSIANAVLPETVPHDIHQMELLK
jgi:predicted ATPase